MSSRSKEYAIRKQIDIYERDYELYKRVLEKDVATESQELDLIENISILDKKLDELYSELCIIEERKVN